MINRYKASECVTFYRNKDRFGGYSNMHPGFPLRINDLEIGTTEALYQMGRFPHRPDVQRIILAQTNGMAAKIALQEYKSDSRPDWTAVRVPVMRWTQEVKLAQHWSKFGALLDRSGDLPIVEMSPRDDFWGAKLIGDQLVGRNELGEIITNLRERWRACASPEQFIVEPPPIPGFLILGNPVEALRVAAAPQTLRNGELQWF